MVSHGSPKHTLIMSLLCLRKLSYLSLDSGPLPWELRPCQGAHKKEHQPVAFTADLIRPVSPSALNLTAAGAEASVWRVATEWRSCYSQWEAFYPSGLASPSISFQPNTHMQLKAFLTCVVFQCWGETDNCWILCSVRNESIMDRSLTVSGLNVVLSVHYFSVNMDICINT
jgi:hypothetical protein